MDTKWLLCSLLSTCQAVCVRGRAYSDIQYISRRIKQLGHAYMGQMSAPTSLRKGCWNLDSKKYHFIVKSCIISHALIHWQCVSGVADSLRIDIESIWWHCHYLRDACCLHLKAMLKLHSDHFTCFVSYRLRAGRNSHKRIRGIAGWSCRGIPEWRAPVRLGWISHTA